MNNKKFQLFELILVLSVSFLPALIVSLYAFFTGNAIHHSSENTIPAYLSWITQGLLSIVLMFYVLYRQGKTIQNIGLKFPIKWNDLAHGIGLIFTIMLARILLGLAIRTISPNFILLASNPQNIGFLNTNIFFLLIIMVVFPIQEELIVRGYTMTEVFSMTDSKQKAIAISVLIQFTYHLYQGFPSAVMSLPVFIVFALYFVKYENLKPVLIAHVLIDLIYLMQR